ncbi:MAG: DUF447 family protein [Gemmataceae bacterium]
MILEGLITTTDPESGMHLAPMGPTVDGPDFQSFLLRPFPTSQTYQNLIRTRQGVLHITDDALLIAKAAIGEAGQPAHHPATMVDGYLLHDCCRAFEFRVSDVDDRHERIHLTAQIVYTHRVRDFFGFNRAKHAVLEAAIMATRFHLIPAEEIDREWARLKVIVNKTAGPAEREAMALLESKWAARAGR